MTQRTFYYGTNPSTVWQNLNYNDGNPIQGSHNWPFGTVVIENWENISSANKSIIRTELTAKGYIEQT